MLPVHPQTNHSFTSLQPDFSESQPKDDSKIPFLFAPSPFRLVDDDVIAGLDGNTVKVLTVLERYIDLTNQTCIDNRWVLSGWTTVISHDRIAQKSGFSRRTVIRKIQILVEAGIIEVKRYGKSCKYRFTDFRKEIKKLEEEGKNQLIEEVTRPDIPSTEMVDNFIQADKEQSEPAVTDQTPILSELTHIKESFDKEIQTLSNRVDELAKVTQEQNPEEERDSQDKSWKDFEIYTTRFYGENVKSKRLKKEASIYFQEKVSEYGISDDGFDVVLEMIPVIKQLGAKTHKAFDTEFGIRAFNKVMDKRDYQLQLSSASAQQAAQIAPGLEIPTNVGDESEAPQTNAPTPSQTEIDGALLETWCDKRWETWVENQVAERGTVRRMISYQFPAQQMFTDSEISAIRQDLLTRYPADAAQRLVWLKQQLNNH